MALTKVQAEGINLADTFAFSGTVTGAGTRKLLRTITISSATSSVDFVHGANDVVLDTTYPRYEILINSFVPETNGQHIRVFVSSNSGSSFYGDSAYNNLTHRAYTNGSTTATDTTYFNDFASYNYLGLTNTANKGGGHATIEVSGIGNAARTVINGQFWGFGETYYHTTRSSGAYESDSTTINAIRIAPTSGNILSGVFKIYGVL